MLIKMLKTYTISVTIQEGQDEFWEDLDGKSGCDEVVEEVRRCLAERGFAPDTGCSVRLERFEECPPGV
jgi:hypothetical protein